MANPYEVQVPNVLQALMAGEQGYKDISALQNDQAVKAGRQEAMQALQDGGDLRSPLAKLIGVGDIKGAEAIATFARSNAQAQGVYGTPIYGTGPNGENQVGAIGKNGQFQKLDTGGFTPTPGVRMIDTGTGFVPVQSRTGQPVPGATYQPPQPGQQPTGPQPQTGYIPKDVAGEAREKKYGAEVGDRQADLGKAKASLDSSISNIDRFSDAVRSVANDPALGKITGIQGVFPNWPGGRAANVQARLDNVTSQAGFAVLQAMRDASKTGGALGQVSDFENRQLQNNLAALSRAQDEKQYREQLQKIIEWGDGVKQRLQAAYNQDYASIPKPNSSAQPTTVTSPRGQPTETKTINGKTYGKVGNQWFEW